MWLFMRKFHVVYQAVMNFFPESAEPSYLLFYPETRVSMWSCRASINWISCMGISLSNIFSLIPSEDRKFRCENCRPVIVNKHSFPASHFFFFKYIYIYIYNLFLNKKNSKNDFYHSHSQLVGNACPESNLLCVLYSTILGNHHPTLTKKNIFVLW